MNEKVASWVYDGTGGPLILATSMINGLADSSYKTWAFRRAELSAFAESPFRCRNGFRATMAQVRSLPVNAYGLTRLLPLASQVLDELSLAAVRSGAGPRLAVLLGLGVHYAERGPESRFASERRLLERSLTAQLQHRGFEATVRTIADGHAAFARALLDAEMLLRADMVDLAVVGGVDSAYDPDVVEQLLDRWRLFDGEKLDSMIPAEGAAGVLLSRSTTSMPAMGRVLGAAIAEESGTMENDVPCMALALTRVAQRAMTAVKNAQEQVDLLFTDLTNEHYRIQEFQLTFPRISLGLSPAHAVEVLYAMLGDLGAATMPTAVGLALESFERGDPSGNTALTLGTSTGPLRGAVCVSA